MTEKRNPLRFCRGKTKAGVACRMYRNTASDFCLTHDPATAQETRDRLVRVSKSGRERSREALDRARRRKEYRARKMDPITLETPVDVSNAEAFYQYCAELVPLILSGRVHPARARAAIDLMKVVSRQWEKDGSGTPMPLAPRDESEPIEDYPVGSAASPPWPPDSTDDLPGLEDIAGAPPPDPSAGPGGEG